ncbi:MAG: hemolysin family protein [Bacilli bacterium]
MEIDWLSLFSIFVLLVLTAFFVATEFAAVKVRPSRIEQLIKEGNSNAIAAKKVITNLDEYLSACQLGITITALGLGWLGEPAVKTMLKPLFLNMDIGESAATVVSFVIAFSSVTFLHVVLGELAPKTVAIQKAEEVTLALAKPIILFYRIMYPFIWLLNGSARLFLSLFGMKPVNEHIEAHTEEELHIILDDSLKSGEINATEHEYVKSIFEFDEKIARDIMVPRREMIVLTKTMTVQEVLQHIVEEKYSRYPVISENKDDVIGILNAKELTNEYIRLNGDTTHLDVSKFIRPIVAVHESTSVQSVLSQLKRQQTHMAIVVDDWGGTAGLLTVEDIMEEIVGDIRDEFDTDEIADVVKLPNGGYALSGKVTLEEFTKLFDIEDTEQHIDTIGGWILAQSTDVSENDVFHFGDIDVKIVKVEGNYISRVNAVKQLRETVEAVE